VLPCVAFGVALVGLIAGGIRPWDDPDSWLPTSFSLVAFSLAAAVVTAISSEFLRGANVVRTQTGKNLVASMGTLMHRNTRRYGGYLVHFGVVVLFIGIAGGAFNQSHEQEMGFGDSLKIGPYKLVCQSYTQDSNANYDTDFALLDVYRGGKKVMQLAPEKRFYHASQTSSTMVALHETPLADLYVIFEGRNPDSNRPIIKAFLNPLIVWIWIGVLIVVAGTGFALVPSASPKRREVAAPNLAPVAVEVAGD
jgi:cytochrome c-type biogenesis protein CcmF